MEKIVLGVVTLVVVLWWVYLVVRLLLYFASIPFNMIKRIASAFKCPASSKTIDQKLISKKQEHKNSAASTVLADAVGPSPWYAGTFPASTSRTGRAYIWKGHVDAGKHIVVLVAKDEPDQYLLALYYYCRVFTLASGDFGVWFPTDGNIQLLCFDADKLPAFPASDMAQEFATTESRYFVTGAPVSQWAFSIDLPSGEHSVEVPQEFFSAGELLMAESRNASGPDEPYYNIYELHPAEQKMIVHPQMWFTGAHFDTGYQWITKVARDPMSGRLIGDGIRIAPFMLAEDGCTLDKLL